LTSRSDIHPGARALGPLRADLCHSANAGIHPTSGFDVDRGFLAEETAIFSSR